MNKKKLIGNLFLIALVVGLGLTFIDFKSGRGSYEDSIQAFVIDRLEEGQETVQYTPLHFEEINEGFLLAKQEVTDPFYVLTDSMQNQLALIQNASISIEFKEMLADTKEGLKSLKLETISSLLRMDASLKREVRKADKLSAKLRDALHQEETRMMNAVNDLNGALGTYNLSVFSLNFEQTETKLYYHTFLLSEKNDLNITNHEAVFELNSEDKEVLSFREI